MKYLIIFLKTLPVAEMNVQDGLMCRHDARSLLEMLALFLFMICVHAFAALLQVVYQVYPLEAKASV